MNLADPAARDLMGRDPITIAADTPLLAVQHLFAVAQIGGAPVVGADGRVVGMISTIDLLRAVDQACDDELDEPPPGDQEPAPEAPGALAENLGGLRALDVATPEVVWVAPDTPASQLARLMRTHGIHRVLVGTDGHLEGIVTTFDLLGLLERRG